MLMNSRNIPREIFQIYLCTQATVGIFHLGCFAPHYHAILNSAVSRYIYRLLKWYSTGASTGILKQRMEEAQSFKKLFWIWYLQSILWILSERTWIDHVWRWVLEDKQTFPSLSELLKACLSFFHATASVEGQ